jgi:hypothetical protein
MKVFVNPDVEKEVMQDFALYVAYRIRYGVYNDDQFNSSAPESIKLSFLHTLSLIELQNLKELKNELSQIKSDFSMKKISEETPKLIGYLKKAIGFNGYKTNEIGSNVFEYKERYQIEIIPHMEGGQLQKGIVRYYKDTLTPDIDFI